MNEKKSLILMVEDEEQVLNTNCRMLRRRGDVYKRQAYAPLFIKPSCRHYVQTHTSLSHHM